MLKKLVRDRLIAVADEIFGLFAGTITSYEEQLCRAREETERHRRQLETVCKTPIIIRVEDLQQQSGGSSLEQEHPQPLHLKEEEEHPQPLYIKEDVKDPQRLHVKEEEEEDDVREFPQTRVSVESKDNKDDSLELSKLHHHSPSGDQCEGPPPPKNLLAPLSDSNHTEEPLRSSEDCEGDVKQSQRSEKETIPGRKETSQACERFTCSVCGKSFVSNSVLIVHVRRHTGEKPFGCSVCGKRFIQRASFVLHMRTHTGEKPFRCSVCHKTFSRKDHMGTHMRTHTGEKPFSCSVCGVRFRHKSSLNVHMRLHSTERIK